jgi:hypothetical protein
MLIFEQLVGRGFMVLDPSRNVLIFNREVVGKFPAIRKAKMEEFKWLVGSGRRRIECRLRPRLRHTPTRTCTRTSCAKVIHAFLSRGLAGILART